MTSADRSRIIDDLRQQLPYPPRLWYKGLSDDQLIALVAEHRKAPRVQHSVPGLIPDHKVQRRINEETGDKEIMSDSGKWVPEYE